MAVDNAIYDMSEWDFLIQAETVLGTAITTGMQKINLNGDVSVSTEIDYVDDIRAGDGRTKKSDDVYVNALGGKRTTITVPMIMDTTVDTMLHENAMGIATSTSPASIDMQSDYAPDGTLHNDTHGGGNTVSMTCYLVSPESGSTRTFAACVISQLVGTMDSGAEGGRRTAVLTIVTDYWPVASSSFTGSGSNVKYGTTYRYLREYTTRVFLASTPVINKIEYTINNPMTSAGAQGTYGDPEIVTRAISGTTFTMTIGFKYDANYNTMWETFRNGTEVTDLVLSDNATWASAALGFKLAKIKIKDLPDPAQTDAGVFQDVTVEGYGAIDANGNATGDIVQLVP